MVAIYVIIGIIMILALLLFSSLHIKIVYNDDNPYIKIRFWFFRFSFNLSNDKNDSKQKNVKSEKEKISDSKDSKISSFMDTIKKHGIFNSIATIKQLLIIILKKSRKLLKHIKSDFLDIDYTVVGNDAADTAIKYGYICSIAYPLQSILLEKNISKKQNLSISAGFCSEKSILKLDVRLHVKTIFLLNFSVATLIEIMKCLSQLRKVNNK